MLEMLLLKPVTATSCYCIVQKVIKCPIKVRSYLVEMTPYPGLQYTKTELNEVEVRGI